MRALALCAFVITASTARAAEHRHRVGATENLEVIAKNYYGAAWKSVYLQARNELDGNPRPGTRIIVPGAWIYEVERGDSLAGLAKRYLGQLERYTALAQFNHVEGELQVGAELVMPFHLRHTVRRGESYASIAQRYYRTTRLATRLRDYNGRTDNTLEPDTKLTVPIFDRATVDVRARAYDPNASKAKASAPPVTARAASPNPPELPPLAPPAPEPASAGAAEQLQAAIADYDAGRYSRACFTLEELLVGAELVEAARMQVVSHLGFCAVAAGDRNAARDYFRKWLELDPKVVLNPVTTSPKILVLFEEAREARNKQEVEDGSK